MKACLHCFNVTAYLTIVAVLYCIVVSTTLQNVSYEGKEEANPKQQHVIKMAIEII